VQLKVGRYPVLENLLARSEILPELAGKKETKAVKLKTPMYFICSISGPVHSGVAESQSSGLFQAWRVLYSNS
jgi:hypothetical protein